ncbi:hypothetical protein UCREL1_10780 [Eutypa lata UCREL1]|uniref:Uncharacterized protein n=1 Tax=Eutypa lata (strain UCR-EL1) TaxID=1287681 RepID=M7S842_EUTLA|nr:hypothetical protein UCREL1_10780 [Eutypa lata UCREL1]
MPQDTAGSERQKQPKRPRKRRDTVGSSQEDELSKGHNNPNPQLPSRDNVIKELQQKLADQTLENETFKKNEQLSQGLKSEYDLAKKLDKANETCEKLRAHWVEATEELEQLQKTGKKFHVDDDSVVSVWNSLAYKIRNLSSKASMRKGHPSSTEAEVNRCHEWRAETNHLLHDNCEKLDKMDEEKQGRLIQGLCLLIKQWSADFGHEELITDLRGILHNLVEFCSITARANAAYVPFTLQRNISHNMQFKDDCMEFRAMTSPERGVVDLIVSPGLAKYGNSDGENYHQREILDKLGVAF